MEYRAPRRVEVIRLFEREFIDDNIFHPNRVSVDSDDWISVEKEIPDSSAVFFVKNQNNSQVYKAIHLYRMPYVIPSRWYHTINDEFIDETSITHWMPISKLKTSVDSSSSSD